MADLTCYLLRSGPEGAVSDFDDALDLSPDNDLTTVGPLEVGGAIAKLYIAPAKPHTPDWAAVLTGAFGDDLNIPLVGGASAVVIVRYRPDDAAEANFFAFTFGNGWRMLKTEVFRRGFGLKTCLNVVFEGDTGQGDWDSARLRSVDSKRVGANVLRARHQVSGMAALEELDVDVRRDLVNGVTGIPTSVQVWGARVTGRDALKFSWPSLTNLAELCQLLLASYQGDDYKARFSFIDDFVGVTDPVMQTRLVEEILAALMAGDSTSLDLAPPELVDWERVTGFQLHTERRGNPVTRPELRLSDYVVTLRQSGQLADLTLERLKQYLVWAVDGDGNDVTRWPVWRCLYGEVELDAESFVIDDGEFYQVSQDYISALDAELDGIPVSDRVLPQWARGWHEDEFNMNAAASSPDYLLLDRKTVRVISHTNQVEICDILTSDGAFIHVKKRGDGSASLSHLFNQGFVSADLAIAYSQFRKGALEKIVAQEEARAVATGDDSFRGRFRPFSEESAVAADCEVIFAIRFDSDVGVESLPFFSKITLRNMVDELHRRGFRVSIKPVERGQ